MGDGNGHHGHNWRHSHAFDSEGDSDGGHSSSSSGNEGYFFAPILIGLFLGGIFFGICCFQGYEYFMRRSKSDSRWMKLFLVYLITVEGFVTSFDFTLVYIPLVNQFFDNPDQSPIFLHASAVATALVTGPVQIFMAYRIHKVAGSRITAFLICIASFIALFGSIWTSAAIFEMWPHMHHPVSKIQVPLVLWLLGTVAADLLIVLYFFAALAVWTSDIPSVLKLLKWSTQCGAVATLLTVVATIMFLTLPKSTAGYLLGLSISKVHLFTLVFSLNSRPSPKEHLISENVIFGVVELEEEDEVERMALTAAKGRMLPLESRKNSLV